VLYYLILLVVQAIILAALHIIGFDPVYLLLSTAFLLLICAIINELFSRMFGAPSNIESIYITALILALLVQPATKWTDLLGLAVVGFLAVATKFFLAVHKKHIFNPVAIAVIFSALLVHYPATWWVGNVAMTPLVVLGGLLVVRKIRREDMVFMFIIGALASTIFFSLLKPGLPIPKLIDFLVFRSSLFFLAFAMLTEPITAPHTKKLQMIFGFIVGALSVPSMHIGSFYFTPELALVAGNIFAYAVSPQDKLILSLQQRIQLSPDTYDFVFTPSKRLNYLPGQYMEWTIAHQHSDSRGFRRYFTLASSPTEQEIRIGVKFYPSSSTYKKELLNLTADHPVIASQLAGDFVLPNNLSKKLVFIAGGIGITPYRSMIKYLIDNHQGRDIVVMYSNKLRSEIVYVDVLEQARQLLGIRTYYTLTDEKSIPDGWSGQRGRISATMIEQCIPDYNERLFYISGPAALVDASNNLLRSMGISSSQIKRDFFPGFA
jgi:ferredoxin-NADP reductase/Na+-translocating ferredoxin:NAD+ oxidoreductase RnfD subunit